MHTTLGTDHITDLPDLQPIRSVFERFLHLTVSKPAEITSVRVGRAVGVLRREFRESIRVASDLGLVRA